MMTSQAEDAGAAQPGRACRAYQHGASTALTRDYGVIAPHARTSSKRRVRGRGGGLRDRWPSALSRRGARRNQARPSPAPRPSAAVPDRRGRGPAGRAPSAAARETGQIAQRSPATHRRKSHPRRTADELSGIRGHYPGIFRMKYGFIRWQLIHPSSDRTGAAALLLRRGLSVSVGQLVGQRPWPRRSCSASSRSPRLASRSASLQAAPSSSASAARRYSGMA